MANKTKKQLADDICKVLFGGDFVYADRQGEEENPDNNSFERMVYVKVRYSNDNTDREQVRAQNYISFDMPDTETAAE